MRSPRRSVLVGYVVVVVVTIGLSVRQLLHGDVGNALVDTFGLHFLTLSAATAAVCALAAVRSRGDARIVWTLIAAAASCNALADIVWTALDVVGDIPYVSIADVIYALGYPLLFAALWQAARARDPEGGTEAMVDGMVVAAGLGLLAWQAVVIVPGGVVGAGLLTQVVVLSYPLLDMLLLGALVGLLLTAGRRGMVLWGLFAYVAVFLVSDIAYSVTARTGSDLLAIADMGYLASYSLLGLVALAPSAPDLARRQHVEEAGPARFLLLGVSVVAPGVTAAIAIALGGGVDPVVLVVTSSTLATVVTVRVARTMASQRDARHRAERAQAELADLALRDQLTGLPNRHALADRLTQLDPVQSVALLFIDLDRFKLVNDTAGHSTGDAVLRQVADRIEGSIRAGDEVYRLAGDEFVALCGEVSGPAEVDHVARRVIDSINPPFEVDGLEWYIGASVGTAMSRSGEVIDPETLLRDADVAMYEAKRQGRRRVRQFDSTMHDAIESRHRLELELRQAVADDAIEPAYQAVVDLASDEIVGFEALARWSDGAGSLHAAAEFIELAEQTGLITTIDEQMLRRACRFIASFNEQRLDLAPAWVSVNISTTELAAGDLAGRVASVLDETGIDPSWLVMELTEGALTVDPDEAVRRLTEVHDLGISLAVDDFGTGFSSLEHLLRFPVDLLKIDRVFVADLARSTAGRSVAAAALRLAETLGIRVVAEGVETAEQAEILRDVGYRLAQGYLFARPLRAADAARLSTLHHLETRSGR